MQGGSVIEASSLVDWPNSFCKQYPYGMARASINSPAAPTASDADPSQQRPHTLRTTAASAEAVVVKTHKHMYA